MTNSPLLNLHWVVFGAGVWAGFEAYPWWTILILGVASVGVYVVSNPKQVGMAWKQRSLVVTMPLLVVLDSIFVGLFFGLGRLVGHIV